MRKEVNEKFVLKQTEAFKASQLMQPNMVYSKLEYMFYVTVQDDSGWAKNNTFCLFKDRQNKILRTRRIKTLEQYEPYDSPKFNSIEELMAHRPILKYQLKYGKEYEIVTSADGSVQEIYGNGLAVIRKGSKIETHNI